MAWSSWARFENTGPGRSSWNIHGTAMMLRHSKLPGERILMRIAKMIYAHEPQNHRKLTGKADSANHARFCDEPMRILPTFFLPRRLN